MRGRRTLRRIPVLLGIGVLASVLLGGCGGKDGDVGQKTTPDYAFEKKCAHDFNVAAAAQIVMPPLWAYNYGAKASINPDAASGACLITVANFDIQSANQYIQTESSWTDTPLLPSYLDSSVQNWNAEVVDGGYIDFTGDQ